MAQLTTTNEFLKTFNLTRSDCKIKLMCHVVVAVKLGFFELKQTNGAHFLLMGNWEPLADRMQAVREFIFRVFHFF